MGRSSEVDRTPDELVICLDIPSSMQLIYVLDSVISEIVREMGFDEESREQVNLAVIEAGSNAIKHGNKEDVNKRAHFEFILIQDKLTVVVQDGGAGFDRENVENPLEPANLLKSSGRGIFLMETCMDTVKYEARGTTVRMVKYK
jgi:serine/threonine-protein kinase RsbW